MNYQCITQLLFNPDSGARSGKNETVRDQNGTDLLFYLNSIYLSLHKHTANMSSFRVEIKTTTEQPALFTEKVKQSFYKPNQNTPSYNLISKENMIFKLS